MGTIECMRVLAYKNFYCNFSLMKIFFLILANVRIIGSFFPRRPIKNYKIKEFSVIKE